jgi:hypothetical protein
MPPRSIDRALIEAEIDQIRSLGLDALRKRWSTMFGTLPPAGLTKDIIARMIAYRIQEDAYGGHDQEIVRLLDGLSRAETVGTELNRHLKPGTVLVREYRGERHTVTIVPNGYLWRGSTYASLSIIARAITGTTWSGPRFFGVSNNDGSEASAQPGHGKTISAGSSPILTPSKTSNMPLRREAVR